MPPAATAPHRPATRRSTRTSRARPHRHRCRGPLPLHHHPARRVPLAQPLQRLAPGAHPLLALRQCVPHAHGDPDVLPGDPLLPYDPMFTCIENEAARNRMVSVFDWESTIPSRRSATASTSCCAAAKKRRWRRCHEPVRDRQPDRRPLSAHRARLAEHARHRRQGITGERASWCRGA